MIVGGHFASLGAARNLAKHGVPVYIADHEICVSQFSSQIKGYLRCPSAGKEDEFVSYLNQTAQRLHLKDCVLFPSTDESVRVLSQRRDCLSEYYRVTTPAWDVVKFLYDKRLTHRLALELQVPIPETCCPGSLQALASLALEYPVVLKPAITIHLTYATKKKAYRANDWKELAALFEMMAAIMDPDEILIQELIPGRADNLYSYSGFFKDGRPVAGFAAKRPRQHPMEFGRASTLAVTVNIPQLELLATKLLSAIGYTGLAEVEFMWDRIHNRYEFLEVNPRIWGWHTLAIYAGVDLPYLAYADALGEQPCHCSVQEGVKWVRLTTDLPVVATEMWNGRLTIGEYVRSIRGSNDALFSLRDPLPFLMDWLLIPYFAKHRGF